MQEILLSFYVNIILMITLVIVIFKPKINTYLKNYQKTKRVARASKANLPKATLVKIVRKEVNRYLEELQK